MTNLNATALPTPQTSHVRQAARAAVRVVAVILAPLARAHRARRDAAHLMGLHDNLLKDIGVSRGEIETIVRTGRCRGL
jgi:uncharacterized protein YjiS (DUF1127 family)